MLNPFPHLLVYGFFAPTLLRVAVALGFLLMSWRFFNTRKETAKVRMPLIGAPGVGLVLFASTVDLAIGLMLLVGWETQIAALLGAIVSLKHAWLAGRWPSWSPRSRSVYIFMAVICLALMLTGAGALAMDLPL